MKRGEAGCDFLGITNMWTDLIHSCAAGESQANYSIRLSLPSSRELPMTRKIWQLNPTTALPAATLPLSQTEEGSFLDKLVTQLNRTLHTDLSAAIQVERIWIRKQNPAHQPPQQQLKSARRSQARK